MTRRTFTQVDVFGAVPLGGNPVAVVHDADGLDGRDMQRLARWFDLSETVFLSPPSDDRADYRARIFTPAEELPFAGHPTLGACAAWLAAGGRPVTAGRVVQECGVGLVELRVDDDEVAFAGPPLRRTGPPTDDERRAVEAVLGLAPHDVLDLAWIDNGPGWLGVRVTDTSVLRGLDTDLRRDPAGRPWYLGVAASAPRGADHDLEVRALFPAGGATLREDPATGSLAAAIGRWWADTGRLATGEELVLRQGAEVGSDARLRVTRDRDDRIWVTGATRVHVTGHVEL